jgi:ribonuclease E
MFFNALTRQKNKVNSSKKMIINVLHPEESRVAIIEDGNLQNLSISTEAREKNRGNIYKGIVQKVVPSLNAAFVEFGCNRQGFLPLDEVQPKYDNKSAKLKILEKNQEVIVQITKEEKGTKGAALTNYISLPGRYLVLMPGHKRTGVSRKIEDESERKKLKEIGEQLKLPDSMGFIIRTAGLSKNKRDLQRDANYLLRLWKAIEKRSRNLTAPGLIYQESSIVILAIRDYFTTDISEVIVDNPEVFKKVKEFFRQVIAKHQKIVQLYEDKTPIFVKFNIEQQIEALYQRTVPLKSGGSISIDPTEALVAIDVNTARFTSIKQHEETALITNMEAADEIARQVRLRDLGGLIVIDFIDMKSIKHRQQVERHLNNAFKTDKANTEISRISKFGLLEMSREHLRTPLFDESHVECGYCKGSGKTRSRESLSFAVLRKISDKALSDDIAEIRVTLFPDVACYLLNNKRGELNNIEKYSGKKITILSETITPADNFKLECIPKA